MPEPPFSSAHRIGFFGGSFDPIHQGHVSVALEVVNKFNLHQVLLCPAYFAPLRAQRPLFPAAHRLGMVQAVARGDPRFGTYDKEVQARKTCYTYHTLQAVQAVYPQSEIFLLLGDDQFTRFNQWKYHQEILAEFPIVIFDRNETEKNRDFSQEFPASRIHHLRNQLFPHSSTEIRQLIQQGTSISDHVPQSVYAYMTHHQLLVHRDS